MTLKLINPRLRTSKYIYTYIWISYNLYEGRVCVLENKICAHREIQENADFFGKRGSGALSFM